MTNGNGQTQGPLAHFDRLAPMIREEYPEVDAEALAATGGDREAVVDLIATRTEKTKQLIRRQLAELGGLAEGDASRERDDEIGRLRRVIDNLQHRTHDVAEYVRGQMVKDAELRVKEHPWVTLLVALGLGLVLGLLLRGVGGGRS